MKRPLKKLKDVIVPFCEGEAEKNLFGFLKLRFSNKKITFTTPKDICGFEKLDQFKRKYNKLCKGYHLKPKKDFSNVKFLFIIDNDLEDSKKINEFLEKEGHYVQLCDPNTEGMILAISGHPQVKSVGDKEYRKKCKIAFRGIFNCEAHKIKEEKLEKIFTNEVVLKNKLPVLYRLFKV